eukprot:11198310-Lingulodinium_polyedra.AAC.1
MLAPACSLLETTHRLREVRGAQLPEWALPGGDGRRGSAAQQFGGVAQQAAMPRMYIKRNPATRLCRSSCAQAAWA